MCAHSFTLYMIAPPLCAIPSVFDVCCSWAHALACLKLAGVIAIAIRAAPRFVVLASVLHWTSDCAVRQGGDDLRSARVAPQRAGDVQPCIGASGGFRFRARAIAWRLRL